MNVGTDALGANYNVQCAIAGHYKVALIFSLGNKWNSDVPHFLAAIKANSITAHSAGHIHIF